MVTKNNKIPSSTLNEPIKPSIVFRAPNGNFLLRALFIEENVLEHNDYLVYTLKDQPHEYKGKVYPSLRQLYVELADVTEYEFANKYLGGWDHWLLLQKCDWFEPYIERWRQELDLRIASQALRNIQKVAFSGDKEAYAASKFLLEYLTKLRETKHTKGRPNKSQVANAAREQAEQDKRLADDLRRIGEL